MLVETFFTEVDLCWSHRILRMHLVCTKINIANFREILDTSNLYQKRY